MTRRLACATAVLLAAFGAGTPAGASLTLSLNGPDRTVARPDSGSVTVDYVATITWSNLTGGVTGGVGVEGGGALYKDATNFLDYDPDVLRNFVVGLAQVAGNTSGSYSGTALRFTISSTTEPGLYTFQQDLTSPANFFVSGGTVRDPARSSVDFSITVTGEALPSAVPEPSTLIGAGTACLAGLGYGWRRRRPER